MRIALAHTALRLPTRAALWDNEDTTKRALRRVFGDPQQRALIDWIGVD